MTETEMNGTIILDDVESKLRDLLLDVADFIDQNSASSKPVLRFAGGWVRDKLLGTTSHDIDVAIDNMTGEQFGERLKEFLEIPGTAEKYGLGGGKKHAAGSLAKIQKNPEASKNLETVTTKIFGLDIDLVNLRKETYTEDSRNPQVEFGTAEEDASRRDATINAMFYNINTGELEDFTKPSGQQDLRSKIIRTPLNPYTTFKDDPLRVLRLIRFASRLGFSIDEDTKFNMGNEDIRKFFLAKITKERVWTEFEKMLKGPDPRMALAIINELDLYRTIVLDPERPDIYSPHTDNWSEVYDTWQSMLVSQDDVYKDLVSTLVTNEDDKFLSWFIASMIPYSDATEVVSTDGGKPTLPLATQIAQAAFKPPNQVLRVLTSSVSNAHHIYELKQRQEQARDVLGMAIRAWGATWRSQTVFSMLHEIFSNPSQKDGIISEYAEFVARIKALGLVEAHTFKPLIDGTALAKALDTRPGVWMKSALDKVMEWQLRHPEMTDPSSAVEEIRASGIALMSIPSTGKGKGTARPDEKEPVQKKQKKGELTSTLVSHFLRETLKPLFSKASRNPELTETGRRRIHSKQQNDYFEADNENAKPWKMSHYSWALDLLAWCCKSLDARSLDREWGFVIPPLLAVLDDTAPNTRAKGCGMLTDLLFNCPADLLKRSGLGPLFEESLYSSMTFLPSLTAEEDSVILLDAALPAIIALINNLYEAGKWDNNERLRALDMAIRKGILQPYSHAGEHVRIAEVLLRYVSPLAENMKIGLIKHLKDLIPLLVTHLSDPFGPAYPPLLVEASICLRNVMLNAWPRIPGWSLEILKGLTVCWIRTEEEGDNFNKEHIDDLKSELKTAAKVLRATMLKQDVGNEWNSGVQKLIQADGRLSSLLE